MSMAGAVPGGASGAFAPGMILRPRISFDDLSQNHRRPRIFFLWPRLAPVWKIPMTAHGQWKSQPGQN